MRLLRKLWQAYRVLRWRMQFRVGRTISCMVARDVKRVVLVESVSELREGFITARIKTTNVLYAMIDLVEEPDFSPPTRVAISDLWNWEGHSWGGLESGWSLLGEYSASEAEIAKADLEHTEPFEGPRES